MCWQRPVVKYKRSTENNPSRRGSALHPPGIAVQQMGDISESQNKRWQPIAGCVIMLTSHFALWHPLTQWFASCHFDISKLRYQIDFMLEFVICYKLHWLYSDFQEMVTAQSYFWEYKWGWCNNLFIDIIGKQLTAWEEENVFW